MAMLYMFTQGHVTYLWKRRPHLIKYYMYVGHVNLTLCFVTLYKAKHCAILKKHSVGCIIICMPPELNITKLVTYLASLKPTFSFCMTSDGIVVPFSNILYSYYF